MLSYQGAGSVELYSIGPVPIPQAVPEPLRAATACVVLDLSYALSNQGIHDVPSYRILSSLTALRRCPAQHLPPASPEGQHTENAMNTYMLCRAALPVRTRMWQAP